MSEKRIHLKPATYYHIYNRAVGSELFFKDDADYYYFLLKIREYLLPVSEIYSYCLQPQQFYLVVYIKEEQELLEYLNCKHNACSPSGISSQEINIEKQLSQIFSNLFSSYARHYNLKYDRIGTLFKRAFMRSIVEVHELANIISDVERAPVLIQRLAGPEQWKYSSYLSIAKNKPSIVSRAKVLELFGSLDNFLSHHEESSSMVGLST